MYHFDARGWFGNRLPSSRKAAMCKDISSGNETARFA